MTLIRHGTQALTGRARSHRTAVVPGAMQIPRNHSDSDVSCQQAPTARCRYLSPSFLASSSRPIFDRPGRSRRLAISYSSARVLGEVPPTRLRRATAAPCLPSAVRVFAGRCVIVFLRLADCWAFFTLRLAACVCLLVAIHIHYPDAALVNSRLPVLDVTGPVVTG